MNTISKRNEVLDALSEFSTKIQEIEFLMNQTHSRFGISALAKAAAKEKDKMIVILEEYFKYERQNNLPVDISFRYIYKQFKKTVI